MTTKLAEVKRHGKHYTPTDLARFLASRVLDQLDDHSRIRVLDPACGDGELLFAIHAVAESRYPRAEISLVGYDLDFAAVEAAASRARERGIDAQWHRGDFLHASRALDPASFDAVITNPPYVRTQQLGQATAQTLAADYGLSGRIDLTHPFVTLLPSLLRTDGVVGLLCSNRFLTTKAGANVRSVLQTSLQPVELYDLGDTKLFDAAVLPAVVVALNREPDGKTECVYTSAYESTTSGTTGEGRLYDALVAGSDCEIDHNGRIIAIKTGCLVPSRNPSEPWRLSHRIGDEWLSSIEKATWRSFGDVAKIRVGIKTTADSVFISQNWDSVVPQPEATLLLPLITHDNVETWQISDHIATKVLYPYDLKGTRRTLADMSRYPNAMAYLESHSERLRARRYVTDGGRAWFEIWVPQRPALWALPKIVFPDISVNPRFALDRSGAVVNGDCYWISQEDVDDEDILYLMLAVANSSLGVRFYDEVCGNKLYSGRRRWMTQYVSKLPLPDPQTPSAKKIVALTRELLSTALAPTSTELRDLDDLVSTAFAFPASKISAVADTLF